MNNWQDKKTVKLGNIGEQLVHDYLAKKGFIVYEPTTDGAHPGDRFVATPDKKTVFMAEIKTKQARRLFPDTGFDLRHFNDYMHVSFKYNMRVFSAFVDSDVGAIYGNWLDELSKECMGANYPRWWNGPRAPDSQIINLQQAKWPKHIHYKNCKLILFPLHKMLRIASIGDTKIHQLEDMSQRNEKYQLDGADNATH